MLSRSFTSLLVAHFLSFVQAVRNVTVSPSDPRFLYRPSVDHWTSSNGCSPGYTFLSQPGAAISLPFEGVAVYIVSSRNRPGGIMDVFIDGYDVGKASRFADVEVESCGDIIFSRENLPSGPHIITLVQQGPPVPPHGEDVGSIALQNVIVSVLDDSETAPPYSSRPTPISPPSESTSTAANQRNNSSSEAFRWRTILGASIGSTIAVSVTTIVAWIILCRRRSARGGDRRVSLASLGATMGTSRPGIGSPEAGLHESVPYRPYTHSLSDQDPHLTSPSYWLPTSSRASPAQTPASPTHPSPSYGHPLGAPSGASPSYPPSPSQRSQIRLLPVDSSQSRQSGAEEKLRPQSPPSPNQRLTEPDIIRIAAVVAQMTRRDTLPPVSHIEMIANSTTVPAAAPEVTLTLDHGAAPPAYKEYISDKRV